MAYCTKDAASYLCESSNNNVLCSRQESSLYLTVRKRIFAQAQKNKQLVLRSMNVTFTDEYHEEMNISISKKLVSRDERYQDRTFLRGTARI